MYYPFGGSLYMGKQVAYLGKTIKKEFIRIGLVANLHELIVGMV